MTKRPNRVTIDLEANLAEILKTMAKKWDKTKAQLVRESLIFLNNYILDNEKGFKWYKREGDKEIVVYLLGYAKL